MSVAAREKRRRTSFSAGEQPPNIRWFRLGEINRFSHWSPAGVGRVLGVFSSPLAQRHSLVFGRSLLYEGSWSIVSRYAPTNA
jgi:hypothetical protein